MKAANRTVLIEIDVNLVVHDDSIEVPDSKLAEMMGETFKKVFPQSIGAGRISGVLMPDGKDRPQVAVFLKALRVDVAPDEPVALKIVSDDGPAASRAAHE